MKQVTVNVYTFNELSEKVREKVKNRYYETTHTNEDFESILKYDWQEAFGNTKMPEIQYDFSCSQGSGVNLYTRDFDYITYGEYKYSKTGLDYYREASKILYDNCYALTLTCNQRYTYSLLDRDLPSALHEIVKEYPDNCQTLLKNFILTLFSDLKDFEKRIWAHGQDYFYDMSDEHYIGYLQDYYFLADGTDFLHYYELD